LHKKATSASVVKYGNPLVNRTMPASDYSTFFSTALADKRQPYDYQSRLADLPCESRLISVPTSVGEPSAATSSSFLAAEKP